jgi:hypothetical protein
VGADHDPGREAVERIARLWQVDEDRLERTGHGFDWWPGRFRVSVTAHRSEAEDDRDAWRLTVRTAFLKDVDLDQARTRGLVAQLASLAPTYAWVHTPREVPDEHAPGRHGTLRFQSTAYLREDTASWLPEFFARMAILQPIDAGRLAGEFAGIVGGQPDISGPSGAAADDCVDPALEAASALHESAGREQSRWQGIDEFDRFAGQFGNGELCLGSGDPGGLTLETPIGSSSALIRLRTDIRHPVLGSGLLSTIEFPFEEDAASIVEDCLRLNFLESLEWSNVPQCGSWQPREAGHGRFRAAHAMFLPNALFSPGLAINAASWQLSRARWAKERLYPDLQDLTMLEVLQRRF